MASTPNATPDVADDTRVNPLRLRFRQIPVFRSNDLSKWEYAVLTFSASASTTMTSRLRRSLPSGANAPAAARRAVVRQTLHDKGKTRVIAD